MVVKKRGRKRTRNPKDWARNKQKVKRARGESYKSVSTGRLVADRTQGNDCKCAKDCIKKLSEEEKHEIIAAFNSLADHEKQDSHLSSLIKVCPVCPISRRRKNVAESKRNRTYKYKVTKIL